MFAIVGCHFHNEAVLLKRQLIALLENAPKLLATAKLVEDTCTERKVGEADADVKVHERIIAAQLTIDRFRSTVNCVVEGTNHRDNLAFAHVGKIGGMLSMIVGSKRIGSVVFTVGQKGSVNRVAMVKVRR